jgi:hypothetical protein
VLFPPSIGVWICSPRGGSQPPPSKAPTTDPTRTAPVNTEEAVNHSQPQSATAMESSHHRSNTDCTSQPQSTTVNHSQPQSTTVSHSQPQLTTVSHSQSQSATAMESSHHRSNTDCTSQPQSATAMESSHHRSNTDCNSQHISIIHTDILITLINNKELIINYVVLIFN